MKQLCRLLLCLVFCVGALSQQRNHADSNEILRSADVTANNVETAIQAHLLKDPGFVPKKQKPDIKPRCFDILVFRNGSIKMDWTVGQHARCVMEELRQGIHALQSAAKPRGLDAVALPAAKSVWPKVRDIVCNEYPGVKYYDLDGFEQYCPE